VRVEQPNGRRDTLWCTEFGNPHPSPPQVRRGTAAAAGFIRRCSVGGACTAVECVDALWHLCGCFGNLSRFKLQRHCGRCRLPLLLLLCIILHCTAQAHHESCLLNHRPCCSAHTHTQTYTHTPTCTPPTAARLRSSCRARPGAGAPPSGASTPPAPSRATPPAWRAAAGRAPARAWAAPTATRASPLCASSRQATGSGGGGGGGGASASPPQLQARV
jgi:hypothetical protein